MSLQPTFTGYVKTTQDALLLFQAAISGVIPQVSRRPHDRERNELIQSGAVFIFNEDSSGIKRWTDGIAWSPSRILNNFLIYRQLDKPFAPGEKKRTAKQSRGRRRNASPEHKPYARPDADRYHAGASPLDIQHHPHHHMGAVAHPHEGFMDESQVLDRNLIGSLVDSYSFKHDGLVKKTISIPYQGQHHHLVSYYRPSEVNRMCTPSLDARFKDIKIAEELMLPRHFRNSLALEAEEADTSILGHGAPDGHYTHTQHSHRHTPSLSSGYRPMSSMPRSQMDMQYEMDLQHHQQPVYRGMPPGQSVSNGYVSGYRPFGASLPAPHQPPQSATSSPAQQPIGQQQPAPHHPQVDGGPGTQFSPQADYYQYSAGPAQPAYQGVTSSNYTASSAARANGSAWAMASPSIGAGQQGTPSRRESVSTGGHSPSLPPLNQAQGYSASYHTYHNAGPQASDPRKLPGTGAPARVDALPHLPASQPKYAQAVTTGPASSVSAAVAPQQQYAPGQQPNGYGYSYGFQAQHNW